MASKATYSRPIRRTTDGYFLERQTTVNQITLVSGTNDVRLDLYDGGPGGQVVYSIESDASSSSPTASFNPPMIFKNKIYGKFMTEGVAAGVSATINVCEPAERS